MQKQIIFLTLIIFSLVVNAKSYEIRIAESFKMSEDSSPRKVEIVYKMTDSTEEKTKSCSYTYTHAGYLTTSFQFELPDMVKQTELEPSPELFLSGSSDAKKIADVFIDGLFAGEINSRDTVYRVVVKIGNGFSQVKDFAPWDNSHDLQFGMRHKYGAKVTYA